jgi:hypothetical protein
MKTATYITGNLLFDGDLKIEKNAKIRLTVIDTTMQTDEVVYRQELPFDASSLAVFKYLPFELRDAELDRSRSYILKAHLDQNGNEQEDVGDYLSTTSHPIVTGLEEFNIQLNRRK